MCFVNFNSPKCKNINIKDIEDNPDKYSLLLMKYGGPNLKVLCKKYMLEYLKVNKQERLDINNPIKVKTIKLSDFLNKFVE